MRTLSFLALAGAAMFLSASAEADVLRGPAVVRIVHSGSAWQLQRNGQPYFIKGGSGASSRLDELVAAGGNSVRSFGGTAILDVARDRGLTVMLGLDFAKPRQGFSYRNTAAVEKQLQAAVTTVERFKDHPAVLVWALGNEVELNASDDERILVWKAMEATAKAIKKVDPNHPVIAVLAGLGQNKLGEVDQYCPSLDAIGINAYGSMLQVPETVAKQGWKRPYIITEFGPRGHWEVEKTAWGLPIEDTSTAKAAFYLKAYEHTVAGQPQSLGSYVFLWGQKQEKTHTWYGVFLPDGSRTGAVDAMQFAWTGKWPANRVPEISGQIRADGSSIAPGVFAPGATARFSADVADPENDKLQISWDLRKDVSDNPSTGGDREPSTDPLPGAILRSNGAEAEIRMPQEPGNYRVFLYARQPSGGAATANLPVRVAASSSAPRAAQFGGARIEQRWLAGELGLPTDWSPFNFLVVELKASSAQRFYLRVFGKQGYTNVQLHPYPGAWVRASLPLEWFTRQPRQGTDMASIGNRSRPGYFAGIRGPFRPLNAVDALGIVLEDPIGQPTVELRSVKLAKETAGDAVLETEPLVDRFGQWTRFEWEGKAHDLPSLEAAWRNEEKELGAAQPGACPYGGNPSLKAKATGYFRVEQIDGKWWFVDPDGHLFLSTGADVTAPWLSTPVDGRKNVFAEMPPADLLPPRRGDREPGASFHTWNLQRRFGPQWHERWVDLTVRRMGAWGMNTIGNWSDPTLWNAKRMPYTIPLREWRTATSYMGLPDVYSDEFAAKVDLSAREQCAARKNDPWLLGYFVANEPPWPGREAVVVDMILEGPDTAIKREAQRVLAGGDTPEARRAFLYRAFERYLETINKAVKKYDPNHLNLGIRFAGHAPEPMVKAAKSFDVYSLNIYDYVPSREYLERVYAMTGLPMLIGEFHFGTPGRGMSSSLRQVSDHVMRGTAYRYYVENAFAVPAMIGAHWFQWVDEPVTGRFDGENYNIGMIDVTDRPYQDLTKAAAETHRRMYEVHAGTVLPFAEKPRVK